MQETYSLNQNVDFFQGLLPFTWIRLGIEYEKSEYKWKIMLIVRFFSLP